MKLIAHRGGSMGAENALSTMIASAKLGADAVECDIRKTKDGVYVIYHDPYLTRLAGQKLAVSDVTYAQMQALMGKQGLEVLTFDALAEGYREKIPILLHIKLTEYDRAFAHYVVNSGLPLIVGVVSLDMLRCFAPLLKPENILAFLPNPQAAESFYQGGAGILRLWEHWLDDITPEAVKTRCPGAEVFIMACDLGPGKWPDIALEHMDGSLESLAKCEQLGADGVLLNKINMALQWRNGEAKANTNG